jgi:hypothetical protein
MSHGAGTKQKHLSQRCFRGVDVVAGRGLFKRYAVVEPVELGALVLPVEQGAAVPQDVQGRGAVGHGAALVPVVLGSVLVLAVLGAAGQEAVAAMV